GRPCCRASRHGSGIAGFSSTCRRIPWLSGQSGWSRSTSSWEPPGVVSRSLSSMRKRVLAARAPRLLGRVVVSRERAKLAWLNAKEVGHLPFGVRLVAGVDGHVGAPLGRVGRGCFSTCPHLLVDSRWR